MSTLVCLMFYPMLRVIYDLKMSHESDSMTLCQTYVTFTSKTFEPLTLGTDISIAYVEVVHVYCRQILISSVDAEEGNELRRQVPYLLAQPPWNDDSALRNNLTVYIRSTEQ